jgi:peptidyl-prolyl cis-trans isomerase C
MSDIHMSEPSVARVNGIALHHAEALLSEDDLRQRACSELLRQAAVAHGFLTSDDEATSDGVLSEAASLAIEKLLDAHLAIPEPSQEACQRHYKAHLASYSAGEKVQVRHILFAVTPGVDLAALRTRAETTLLDVRCHDGKVSQDAFAKAASAFSNCPSGADGGALGWLTTCDCAPEFGKEIFGQTEVGVLPRLVHSRFGLHVVEVIEREAGAVQNFEAVQGAVAMALRQKTFVTALRQYLSVLAAQAQVDGVDLEPAQTPLVQ